MFVDGGVVFFERVLVFVEGCRDPRLREVRDVAKNHASDFAGLRAGDFNREIYFQEDLSNVADIVVNGAADDWGE